MINLIRAATTGLKLQYVTVKAPEDASQDSLPADQVQLGQHDFQLGGTGAATPIVSGKVAQMLSSNPDFTVGQIKAQLLDKGEAQHSPRIIAWMDFVDGSPTPCDKDGRGTHVAGTAMGNGSPAAVPETEYLFADGFSRG